MARLNPLRKVQRRLDLEKQLRRDAEDALLRQILQFREFIEDQGGILTGAESGTGIKNSLVCDYDFGNTKFTIGLDSFKLDSKDASIKDILHIAKIASPKMPPIKEENSNGNQP